MFHEKMCLPVFIAILQHRRPVDAGEARLQCFLCCCNLLNSLRNLAQFDEAFSFLGFKSSSVKSWILGFGEKTNSRPIIKVKRCWVLLVFGREPTKANALYTVFLKHCTLLKNSTQLSFYVPIK